MLMLLAPLKRLTGVNESLQRGLAAAESVFALIDEEAEPDSGHQRLERSKGAVEFRDVSFSYDAGQAGPGRMSRSPSSRARRWRWWGSRAAARPRW